MENSLQQMNMNTSLQSLGLNASNCYEYAQPMINAVYQWYPSWGCWHEKSKIEQSFKIEDRYEERVCVCGKSKP